MKNELFKALKAYNRWVCWRCIGLKNDGTFRIEYHSAVDTDTPPGEEGPVVLSDLKQAVHAVRSNLSFDGIAFSLAAHLPCVCIIVSHCVDQETGRINKTAARVLDMIQETGGAYRIDHIKNRYKAKLKMVVCTYMELSIDKTGLKIWGLGKIPAGKESRLPGVAIRQSGYIPITGEAISNAPLWNLQAVIDSLIKEPPPAEPSTRENETEPGRKAGEIS